MFIDKVNFIPKVFDHCMGKNHTPAHHMTAGAVVMVVGVTLAKLGGGMHYIVLEYAFDIVGYAVHGIGCIPFIEHYLETLKNQE